MGVMDKAASSMLGRMVPGLNTEQIMATVQGMAALCQAFSDRLERMENNQHQDSARLERIELLLSQRVTHNAD